MVNVKKEMETLKKAGFHLSPMQEMARRFMLDGRMAMGIVEKINLVRRTYPSLTGSEIVEVIKASKCSVANVIDTPEGCDCEYFPCSRCL